MARPTTWETLEPTGFGVSSFGSPSTEESGLLIHQRGFGDPKTLWTEYNGG